MSFQGLRKQFVPVLCVIALGALHHGASPAAKPGGGGGGIPPAPGTIYYQGGGFWSMNGDGSGKSSLPAMEWPNLPTWQRHGDSRWFLENRYVEGIPGDWGQWYAVDEAGNRVQLTNDPDLRTNGHPAAWARDDSFFSYCGIYETADEWIGRLFVVPVDWTGDAPTAGPATVVFEDRRLIYDEWGNFSFDGLDEVSLGKHDWSPAGDEAVLTRWVWGEGWVLDIATFTESGVATQRLAYGANPEWSPNGAGIAFNRNRRSGSQDILDVWTINADGTGAVQLTTYSNGRGSESKQYSPTWSPDGAYIACTQEVIKSGKVAWSILRVPAAGGATVNLTSDVGNAWLPRWRP
jgi:hypothetical protein